MRDRNRDKAKGRVKCGGKWHHVEVDGKAIRLLDHSEEELAAERAAVILGGGMVEPCPCVQVLDAVMRRLNGLAHPRVLPTAIVDLFIAREARRQLEIWKARERRLRERALHSKPGLRRP